MVEFLDSNLNPPVSSTSIDLSYRWSDVRFICEWKTPTVVSTYTRVSFAFEGTHTSVGVKGKPKRTCCFGGFPYSETEIGQTGTSMFNKPNSFTRRSHSGFPVVFGSRGHCSKVPRPPMGVGLFGVGKPFKMDLYQNGTPQIWWLPAIRFNSFFAF